MLTWAFLPSAQAAPTLDLTTAGSSGFVNGAYFEQDGNGSSGTGTIMSFVRISTNDAVEEGYNTDYRPLEFDENPSPTFTRSLLLSDVPIVNKGGIDYREFRLDINQSGGSKSLLSLDTIEIYLASAGNLTGYPASLGTKIFDLDGGSSDNWILLDADLAAGSGGGQDMTAFIPDSLFVGGTYVYLYSKLGESESSAYPNNDGFEEWSVLKPGTPPPVPVPGALLLAIIGTYPAIRLHRRKVA